MTPKPYIFDWTLAVTALLTAAICGLMIAAAMAV